MTVTIKTISFQPIQKFSNIQNQHQRQTTEFSNSMHTSNLHSVVYLGVLSCSLIPLTCTVCRPDTIP